MSQSANTARDEEPLGAEQSHQDMSAMMRQGRSFSGRERNCFFLNTGSAAEDRSAAKDSERFADVSAISGVDFPDDGRGVAILDWDADGDLDAWISNRNAPRLRLLRNDTPRQHAFLALRLQGDGQTTNRDAIGARVEVVLADAAGRPRIKTLKAGEGFISQSTKWLHFGLGTGTRIEKVVVRWPNQAGRTGAREEFSQLEGNRRYLLVQGRGVAEPVEARSQVTPLEPSTPDVFKADPQARVPLVTLFRPPRLYIDSDHNNVRVTTGSGKSVLLNLWASWCQPCAKELREFSERADELRRAGVEIVALSVDELDIENGDPAAATAFLSRIRFPFASVFAAADAVQGLEAYDRLLTAINRPLPVPSSFLLDPQGRLTVIYKGAVSVDDLLRDVAHGKRNRKQRWLASAPLGGRTIDHPHVTATAEAYEATLHYRRGTVLAMATGRIDDAEYCFREALRYHKDFAAAHDRLGTVLFQKEDLARAQSHLERAVGLDPTLGWAHQNLSRVLIRQGQVDQAVVHLREAVRYQPDEAFQHSPLHRVARQRPLTDPERLTLQMHERLAHRMATHPRADMRNGAEAVRWAGRVVDATGRNDPTTLRTLAAAYAEVGRFREAVEVMGRAIVLAKETAGKEVAAQKKSLRETPAKEPGTKRPKSQPRIRDLERQLQQLRERKPLRAK